MPRIFRFRRLSKRPNFAQNEIPRRSVSLRASGAGRTRKVARSQFRCIRRPRRPRPGHHLILLGFPEFYRPRIDAMSPDIRRRVRILPECDSDQTLRALYGSLDCFIHAAKTGESFGLVLTEAMLCGAPVVTVSRPYKDNSQIEVVRNGVDGLVAGSFRHFGTTVRQMWERREFRETIRPILRTGYHRALWR